MPKLTPAQLAKLAAVKEHQPARAPGELLPHVRFVGDIKHLLVDPDYAYAESTLRGILETVERTQFVTAGQRRAVENIAAARSPERSRHREDRRSQGYRSDIRRRRWDE